MPILGIGVGEYNITTGNQRSSGRRNQKVVKPQTMKIDQIIVHPEYASSESGNDIALIHLKEQIECTDLIRPICLPDPLLLDADNEIDFFFFKCPATAINGVEAVGAGCLQEESNDPIAVLYNY